MQNALILLTGRRNRRFKFNESRQLFIRAYNDALTVAAMRISYAIKMRQSAIRKRTLLRNNWEWRHKPKISM
jgi:hypothetical protein